MGNYSSPFGYEGLGKDIIWCNRIKGRKKCGLCFHYADLGEWTNTWNWFYLLKWRDIYWYYFEEFAHFRWHRNRRAKIEPGKYRNTGLKEQEIKALLKRGCKNNKKCICMNVVQRAFWYCPDCYNIIKTMAHIRRQHIHDIMITDRNEMKAEILILKLSGSINF